MKLDHRIECENCGENDGAWKGWQPPRHAHAECFHCGHCRSCGIDLSSEEAMREELRDRVNAARIALGKIRQYREDASDQLDKIEKILETLDNASTEGDIE